MSARPRNACWDALVQATGANPDFSTGRIAAALKGIRAAALREGFADDEAIAEEIPRRARAYQQRFPSCALTPTALATHWCRVMTQNLTVEEQAIAKIRAGL